MLGEDDVVMANHHDDQALVGGDEGLEHFLGGRRSPASLINV